MNIAQLVSRFEFYARRHKLLKHIPGDKKNKSFLECDIEQLQSSIKNGLKFPCLLLQTPEVGKEGGADDLTENWEGSFMVLMPADKEASKSSVYDLCKSISDQIINHIIADSDEYFEGKIIQTSEGKAGPTTDQLYGWGVNFGFAQAYNGEMDPSQWEEEI